MKKVLIVSYFFPPASGVGIHRPLKFVKYLPDFGIEPVVFCPKDARWRVEDVSVLNAPFLRRTKVYRRGVSGLRKYYDLRYGKGYTNHPYFYLLGLQTIWFMDFFSRWYFECRKEALEIAEAEKVDCVLTTSPPHSSHMFGRYAKKTLGIPWVMDLRDPMVDNPQIESGNLISRLQTISESFYENNFYGNADAIVTVSDPIAASMKRRYPKTGISKKITVITNGYDEEDFPSSRPEPEPKPVLTVAYTGAFFLRQTPEHFLEAIRSLVDQNRVEKSDLRFRFMGRFDKSSLNIFQKYSGQIPIELLDFQPHERSLAMQMKSDLLLLVVSTTEREGGAQIFTGKFFEYLGAGRPIFALAPEGPLKKAIETGRFGTVVPPRDVDKIAEGFKKIYDAWKKTGTVPHQPDAEYKSRFTRKRLTGQLAEVIKRCL